MVGGVLIGGGAAVKNLVLVTLMGLFCSLVGAEEGVTFVETQQGFSEALHLEESATPRYREGRRGVDEAIVDFASVELLPPPDAPRARSKILFESGSARISDKSYRIVENLGRALQGADALIRVEGHADSKGPAEYNRWLSEQRAKAVADYLSRVHGVAPERLRAEGFGEDRPIASNATEEGRAMNRRVEFVRVR